MHCIKTEKCKSIHVYEASHSVPIQDYKRNAWKEKNKTVLSQEEMLSYNVFIIRPECVEMNLVFVFLFRPLRNHKVLESALYY